MKRCPYCKKEIRENLVCCPYCRKDLTLFESLDAYNRTIIEHPNQAEVYGIYINFKAYFWWFIILCLVFLWGDNFRKCSSLKEEQSITETISSETTTNNDLELAYKGKYYTFYFQKKIIDDFFNESKLYVNTSQGNIDLGTLIKPNFDYVIWFDTIDNYFHFIVGKDGYGRGMTNYYMVYDGENDRIVRCLEGHYIKIVDDKVRVVDFDGNETFYELK